MPNIGRRSLKPKCRRGNRGNVRASPQIGYAQAEAEAHEKAERDAARIEDLRILNRWGITREQREKVAKRMLEVSQSTLYKAAVAGGKVVVSMIGQVQTDDLNAEKMTRLDALKPTEIVGTVDVSEDAIIAEALERGLVDRLPARLRERLQQIQATQALPAGSPAAGDTSGSSTQPPAQNAT